MLGWMRASTTCVPSRHSTSAKEMMGRESFVSGISPSTISSSQKTAV